MALAALAEQGAAVHRGFVQREQVRVERGFADPFTHPSTIEWFRSFDVLMGTVTLTPNPRYL